MTNYSRPVTFFDHPVDDDPIWPCVDCLPWHIDILIDPSGTVRVRHWHAINCPVWTPSESGAA